MASRRKAKVSRLEQVLARGEVRSTALYLLAVIDSVL